MNYQKIYEQLIDRGKNRILSGYVETHHIRPVCLGGTNDNSNLVELTPEEHYLAHQLLCKIYPKNGSLAKAALMMTANRPSNKIYGWIRRKHAKAMSEAQTGESNSQFDTMWICNEHTRKSKKVSKDSAIPEGWKKGRFVKLKTNSQIRKEKNEKERKDRIEKLRTIMYYYRDNSITMRELSKKFDVGHNVYVSFERYFKEEYHQIVKNKKGNSNITKGRY